MVHRQQHHVVLLAKFNQSHTDQRPVRKVEGALRLLRARRRASRSRTSLDRKLRSTMDNGAGAGGEMTGAVARSPQEK